MCMYVYVYVCIHTTTNTTTNTTTTTTTTNNNYYYDSNSGTARFGRCFERPGIMGEQHLGISKFHRV